MGVFWGEAAAAYLVVRGMVAVSAMRRGVYGRLLGLYSEPERRQSVYFIKNTQI